MMSDPVRVLQYGRTYLRDVHVSHTLCWRGLEHLKIKTKLIDEKLESVMGVCVFVKLQAHCLYLELHVKLPS
jgi:hypothetical protein